MDDNHLVNSICKALNTCDEKLLQSCIKQTTIETVLEFEFRHVDSPLHLGMKMCGKCHLSMVQCLLRSGMVGSADYDQYGQTILEIANRNEHRALLEPMINLLTEGLDGANACYSILRHDSVPIFQTFLDIKKFLKYDEFQHIAGALIQLNVKNVKLSDDLHMFALWKLSDYGFQHLSGNWLGTKDPNEWKQHIQTIKKCSKEIVKHHDTGLYDDVDDLFLLRLHRLHNHLYFIKHKQFLACLPMQEAIFCVAIFLSIYRNATEFREYRLMINKCLVIEFIRMISRQLTQVEKCLARTEKDLLAIVRDVELANDSKKTSLIIDLLEKIKSSRLHNSKDVVNQYRERVNTIGCSKKDGLIEELIGIIKRFDRPCAQEQKEAFNALNKAFEMHLLKKISKQLHQVPHPQNITNRFMGARKKGKASEAIVAEIVSDESFDFSHIMQLSCCTRRKLIDCFTTIKQHYSLQKILYYCEQMISTDNGNTDRPSTIAEKACMKRTVQVIGEAIKNTTNSPNLPGRAQHVVYSMLTTRFQDTNKQLRELYSHSVSLKKVLTEDAKEESLCILFRSQLKKARAAFHLLCTLAVSDIKKSFYEHAGQCTSLEQIRSLALYAGDMKELENRQTTYFQQAKEFYDELCGILSELESSPNRLTPALCRLQQHINLNRHIIRKLGQHLEENAGFSYEKLRKACFAGDNLDAIKRMLEWKRTTTCVDKFFHKLCTSWPGEFDKLFTTNEPIDHRLMQLNETLYSTNLGLKVQAMNCAEAFDYIEHTRELLDDLGVEIGEEALEQLNNRLKSYYNNMFFLDNKVKVLKAFFKEHTLVWNEYRFRSRLNKDKQYLQTLYDERRAQLRSILGITDPDSDLPTRRLLQLPAHELIAIEYVQLEMCEMLCAAGYFGDSFHYLKHRIPMIQGKNYRNFLAHDTLSYSLLMDSSAKKIVIINAFVFATRTINLYSTNENRNPNITLPTWRNMTKWVEKQIYLLKAFRAGDKRRMHAITKAGGVIKNASFCSAQNSTYGASDFFQLSELVNPCKVDLYMVQYMIRFFNDFYRRCYDRDNQREMAKKLRDYQALYDRTIAVGEEQISEELFDWPEFIKHVRNTDLFEKTDLQIIFKKLIEHGNVQGVSEMLPYLKHFTSTEDWGPLSDAMLYCGRSITDLLVMRTSVPHPASIQLAIILHWNDIFAVLMNNANIEEATYQLLLKTAIQAGNRTVGEYLLKTPSLSHFIQTAFEPCALAAVHVGDANFLKSLLLARDPLVDMKEVAEFIKQVQLSNRSARVELVIKKAGSIERVQTIDMDTLANIIFEAALQKRWKCVEVLLEHGAPIDKFFTDTGHDESCALLLVIKHGQFELLRNIKSINREMLGTPASLPFAVAVRNGVATAEMIHSLQQLGFDWMDSSTVLHEAIRLKNDAIVEMIFHRVDEFASRQSASHYDYFQLALNVLYRWKMISFVVEWKSNESSLYRAVRGNDKAMIQKLLTWGCHTRTIPGVGVLGGIVFERESFYTSALNRRHDQAEWNTSLEEMIVRMESCALLKNMKWQQFTIQAQSIPIIFNVLTPEGENIVEPTFMDDPSLTLNKPDSLKDCLKDLLVFSNNKLSEYDIIFASFAGSYGMTYFWKIEQTNCTYDVLSSTGDPVDLSDMINCSNMRNETPLHYCSSIDIAKLLVENGANPLLPDHIGFTPMHVSMLDLALEFDVAKYLFDTCIERGLRTEEGYSVVDLPRDKYKLLHTAVMVGRLDIIKRLLQHGADASAVNTETGQTPALLAAATRLYKSDRIVNLLLDHDASSIDHVDATGFTLVQYAASCKSTDLLNVVLKYEPNLLLCIQGPTALGIAVQDKMIDCVNCILQHAENHNIRGLTQVGSEDLVAWSLMCNNQETSINLLEYEMQHTLAEANERDVPRLWSVLRSHMSTGEPVLDVINRNGYYESRLFLNDVLIRVLALTNNRLTYVSSPP